MIFYVIELQSNEEAATSAIIPYAYADKTAAETHYHQVLMAAAGSEIRKHGCMLVNEDGFILKSEFYNHENIDE